MVGNITSEARGKDCKTMTVDLAQIIDEILAIEIGEQIPEGDAFFYLCTRAVDTEMWYYSYLSFTSEPDTIQGPWIGPFNSRKEAIEAKRKEKVVIYDPN